MHVPHGATTAPPASRKSLPYRQDPGPATRCPFVFQESIATDHGNLPSVEGKRGSLGNRLIEGNAVGTIQNIHASGRHAELQNTVICGEVLRSYLKGLERRLERRKCLLNAFSVTAVRPDQHIHILGSTWVPVKSDRVPSNQDELCAGVRQLEQ